MLGIPASTIRYYDRKGLLPDVDRDQVRVRRFDEANIEWLRLIERLKMAGMTIGEIREFTDLYRQGDATIEQRRAIIHARRDAIEEQLRHMEDTLDFITYKCWFYDTAAREGTCDAPRAMSEDDMPADIAAIRRRCGQERPMA
ncbi:transcriptional regulator [Bifidobacterium pseudolongum subsp. globosum]|uniref:Transcriptional regulator n=1 Tax=Bifidobacterium pseudolongum subsp. globosum TaxID=1690 RepID=A0A2N3QGU2_9BIFI|nr:MerR family transcriptional regulator [Bifidobacterium pseudolongum]PKU90459.1 transcriptional regulator [Bifidobacterium pseudolongum subsp. globosum]